jgi:extracellular factor (EF) 3-hydroxypalmitic acid methyl ester biosynthesis protein
MAFKLGTNLSGINSTVMFDNSKGLSGYGSLVHITRDSVVFELYNPFSIVQLSEVLKKLRVVRGTRIVYKGKAIVSNLVTTGLTMIVSVSLVDPWSDLSGLVPGKGLKEETTRFVTDWEENHQLRPSYQLIVSKLRNFLGEFSTWMQEAEAQVFGEKNERKKESSVSFFNEFYEEIKDSVGPKVTELFLEFEQEAGNIPPEEVNTHKAFARKEVHPLILCSPFVQRVYIKPLGYAGDYEMVNMVLKKSKSTGSSTYAKIVNSFHIETVVSKAHRNRVTMLQERLKQEAERVSTLRQPFTVLNIGCGPAAEIQHFIRKEKISDQAIFHLMDFNKETIDYANNKINLAIQESGNKPQKVFILRSIDELLKKAYVKGEISSNQYDMVYCAGLFDYFSSRICKRLVGLFYDRLRPGGLLTLTNVHPNNSNRHQMEHLLEWYLVYRNEKDMEKLSPPEVFQKEIRTDSTGVNIFLDIRKEP